MRAVTNPSLAMAGMLDLHPVHAIRLVDALRSNPDGVLLLADALEAHATNRPAPRDTISLTPVKPTWEATQKMWSRNTNVDEAFVRGQYEHHLRSWMALYAHVGPKRSNNLVRRAIAAMKWDWSAHGDDAEFAFKDRFGSYTEREVFRCAVRPWPVNGWRGVEVGNVRFGKLGERLLKGLPPLRKSDTPRDFYRLLYLLNPTKLDFDDMYGQGLFGIVSPCHRFAMSFYFHKYELAAFQFVKKEFAVRTREERGPFIIHCGVPGADNGVGTADRDAKRWFRMVAKALGRTWDVYSGNNFRV